MKRVTLLIILILAFSLVGCGSDSNLINDSIEIEAQNACNKLLEFGIKCAKNDNRKEFSKYVVNESRSLSIDNFFNSFNEVAGRDYWNKQINLVNKDEKNENFLFFIRYYKVYSEDDFETYIMQLVITKDNGVWKINGDEKLNINLILEKFPNDLANAYSSNRECVFNNERHDYSFLVNNLVIPGVFKRELVAIYDNGKDKYVILFSIENGTKRDVKLTDFNFTMTGSFSKVIFNGRMNSNGSVVRAGENDMLFYEVPKDKFDCESLTELRNHKIEDIVG